MEPVTVKTIVMHRAYWLIKLRWVAVILIILGTVITHDFLNITLQETSLYTIAILAAAYNSILFFLLKRFTKKQDEKNYGFVKKFIIFQMVVDLFIFTVLLHCSGGVENPFIFFFIFHMIIAVFFLSLRQSFLLATLSVSLFGSMILLEYLNLIPHHCLEGYIVYCSYQKTSFILGTFFVFTVTLYLVVYITGFISSNLQQVDVSRNQVNTLISEENRIKYKYIAHFIHDIKGHIATIQSCLSIVLTGTLDKQSYEFVDRAYKRTCKMTNFLKMFMKLTKIRQDGRIEMEVFSLNHTVHRVIDALKIEAREKSVQFHSCFSDTLPNIYGNESSIEEMLKNVLLIIINYTPANGEILFDTSNNHDFVQLQICAKNMSVPIVEQLKTLDETHRNLNATDIKEKSSDLEWITAKYIAEIHGGKISVDGKEGERTIFTIMLPC